MTQRAVSTNSNDKELLRAALIIAVCGSFITPFMASSINVALPVMGEELHLDTVMLGWVPTAFILAAAALLVPFGKIADIYGRKKVYLYGMALMAASSLLCAAATTAEMLILSRVIQGIAAAMIFSTGMAIITSIFPPDQRGKAIGINVAVVYIGQSIGPFIGGIITQHVGWRGIFLVNVPFAFLTIVLIFTYLKTEWAEAAGEKLDLIGSVLYVLALITSMYGFSLLPSFLGLMLFITGIIGLIGFVRWERHTETPVFEMTLLTSNKVFALSSLAALLNYGATFSVTFLLSLYLQNIQGLTPTQTGTILIIQPTVMAMLSPVTGRLSDRIEPRILATLGMLLTVCGLFLLTFLKIDSPLMYIVVSLIVLGLGFALFSSPNMNAIMGSVDKHYYGLASGSVATMRLLGQMLSMGTVTLIFSLVMGRVKINPEYHMLFMQSIRYAFFVSALFCSFGIFASLSRGNLRSN